VLNEDVTEIIDRNLGGSVSKGLTNVQVDLNATESQNLRLVLSGTLTANVLVTTQAVGMTIVENNCTGDFAVTFRHNSGGTPITIPNASVTLVATQAAAANPKEVGREFPTGTRMLFQQTAAPTGWVKDTGTANLNNSAIRLTTGTVGTGGSVDFTTALTSKTPTGTVGGTVLTTDQIPAHGHPFNVANTNNNDGASSGGINLAQGSGISYGAFSGAASQNAGQCIGGTGGNQSHNHGLTMDAINLAVRYFDVIVAARL
jgi:microcystin-dependent protein